MIKGIIKDKLGKPINECEVFLKDKAFKDLARTKSDSNGYFELPDLKSEYLVAVKDYRQQNLEYWCKNPSLSGEEPLNIVIDKLEIYGLNSFVIGGGYPSLFVYFRPMSLAKFISRDKSLFPDQMLIDIKVDGKDGHIVSIQKLKEYCGDMKFNDAVLVQVKGNTIFKKLEVSIRDKDGNVGTATLFKK